MDKLNLCDIKTIKSILEPHGFRFSKALGQNFLINASVPKRIAETIPQSGWGALEVGPGIGCLTAELAARAERVVCVELDRRLIPVLSELFSGDNFSNVSIVQGDILKTDIGALVHEKLSGLRLAVCANLPYYITTPAISALIDAKMFESIVVMVQKEVAKRICAKPDTPDYGAFTVYANFYTEPEILFGVSAGSFMPPPKVESAVVRMHVRTSVAAKVDDEKLFFAIVRAAFGQRRKTLGNALSTVLGGRDAALSIMSHAKIDPQRRGETLSIAEFAAISACAWSALPQSASNE